MELSMSERRSVTRATAKRYKEASKKEKGRILDEFVQLTGYTRCYASYVLRTWNRKAAQRMNRKTTRRRKNDNCYVEQKNYSVVRRAVGYARYDTEAELEILNTLYQSLRPYTNFFQPVMKLVEKTRNGSKVRKKYDRAKTPYQRVLDSPYVSEDAKEVLKRPICSIKPLGHRDDLWKSQACGSFQE